MLGMIGFVFLLFCVAYFAIIGWAVSEGGPHAFKGDVRVGLIFWLIALALIFPAILFAKEFDPASTLIATACRSPRPTLTPGPQTVMRNGLRGG